MPKNLEMFTFRNLGISVVSGDKFLTAVGVNDEQVAHLRLMLRRAPASLRDHWSFGTEDNADLIVIDPQSYLGRMARDRAASRGRRCAVVHPDEPLRTNELRLSVPFNAARLSNVLNQAADLSTNLGELGIDARDDFGEVAAQFDLLTDAPEVRAPDAMAELTRPLVATGLEVLFNRAKEDSLFAKNDLDLKVNQTTEGPQRVSSRSTSRAGSIVATNETDERVIEAAPMLLRYLDSELLGGPAVIALPGVPKLVLDTKHRLFYSAARHLQELTAYCTQPLRAAEWRAVTSSELQRIASSEHPRPYVDLIWLDRWTHADGKLAAHLPPSANFRLLQWPRLDDAIVGHRAIAEALMTPGRVHEIVARSCARQNDVVDLINAYDSIGLIEVRRDLPSAPRARTESPDPNRGLVATLRRTFGKF